MLQNAIKPSNPEKQVTVVTWSVVMEGLKIILILAAFFNYEVEGACKAHDASWNRGTKPRVTQPQRREPDKVLIDWSRSIRNARCVDSYNIYVWKVGQPKGQCLKITQIVAFEFFSLVIFQ